MQPCKDPMCVAQGDSGSQAAICKFIGRGGRVDRDTFYKRLAATPGTELPRSISPVDIIFASSSGMACIPPCKLCFTVPQHVL